MYSNSIFYFNHLLGSINRNVCIRPNDLQHQTIVRTISIPERERAERRVLSTIDLISINLKGTVSVERFKLPSPKGRRFGHNIQSDNINGAASTIYIARGSLFLVNFNKFHRGARATSQLVLTALI